MDGKFPGLSKLMASLPEGGTICGYTTSACSYKWSDTEKRWVDAGVKPTHYVKYPGEDWREVK